MIFKLLASKIKKSTRKKSIGVSLGGRSFLTQNRWHHVAQRDLVALVSFFFPPNHDTVLADLVSSVQAVRDVLQRMSSQGITLREDTFNTLMASALKTDDTQLVPNLFSQLLSLNLRPDSLSFTALITALSRLYKPEEAVSFIT